MNNESMQRIDRWFVGRQDYLDEFKDFIKGDRDYHVLYISGPGGIGKTWLLRQMMATVCDTEIPDLMVVEDLIDMYSTANHHIDGVQERVASLLEDTLEKKDDFFVSFRQCQHELETGLREHFSDESIEQMRQKVRQSFLADCRLLAQEKTPVIFFDTFERVQRDPVGGWIMSELVKELPRFRFVIASREPWGGNSYVHVYPLTGFTSEEADEYFVKRGLGRSKTITKTLDAIREKAAGHPLLIELALEWLSGNLLRDHQALRDLSLDDFRETMMTPLREMGRGLFGAPGLDEAIHQTILFMAYFNRRFNADLLARLVDLGAVDLEKFSPEAVLSSLEKEFFFVKKRPDGYIQLHDEMEALVLKYLWPVYDRTGDYRRELAQIACDWYDDQIAQASDKARDDLRAEQLTYMIDVDLGQVVQRLDAYDRQSASSLNFLLVTEIKPGKVEKIRSSYRYQFAVDMGMRATHVYLYERAREYWKIALAIAEQNNNPDQQIEALLGLHNCTYQTDLQESLVLLGQALALCDRCESRRPTVLYEMGFTYRCLEDIQNAINWYQQAMDVAGNLENREIMPTILNDMGYTFVFLGDYLRAEYLVKHGLDLRQKKLDELEKKDQEDQRGREKPINVNIPDPQLALGFSFNTLGQIYRFKGDLAAATGAYSKALSIFKQEKSPLWRIMALHSRGEAHRRIAEVLYGQGRTNAGERYEKLTEDDLEACLELCDRYGIDNEKHTALRRMGRLLHDRALRTSDANEKLSLFDQARQYFIDGIEIATRTGNALEELENLTELAFLADDRLEALMMAQSELHKKDVQANREDIERFREGIKRHQQDEPRIYQFSVFKHLLQVEEGAFYYVTGNYEEALKLYLAGFKGLASDPGYGSARYRQHLAHLLKRLRALQDQEREEQWCQTFIDEWKTTEVEGTDPPQTLAQVHPELVERMKLHLDTAFAFRD